MTARLATIPAPSASSAVSELADARARRAWLATRRGTAPAADCAAMALDALHDGTLLDAALHTPAYHRCVGVLIMTDALDEARDAIAALRWRAPAAAAWYDSELAFRTGDLIAAEPRATEALELAGEAAGSFIGAMRVVVCARAERGAFADAHEVLRSIPQDSAARLRARACLYLAEGAFEAAYLDARELGRRRERQRAGNPAWDGWRSTAALALPHLKAARRPRRWPRRIWRTQARSARPWRSPARSPRVPWPNRTTGHAPTYADARSPGSQTHRPCSRAPVCGSSWAVRSSGQDAGSRPATRSGPHWPTRIAPARCRWPSKPGAGSSLRVCVPAAPPSQVPLRSLRASARSASWPPAGGATAPSRPSCF